MYLESSVKYGFLRNREKTW